MTEGIHTLNLPDPEVGWDTYDELDEPMKERVSETLANFESDDGKYIISQTLKNSHKVGQLPSALSEIEKMLSATDGAWHSMAPEKRANMAATLSVADNLHAISQLYKLIGIERA